MEDGAPDDVTETSPAIAPHKLREDETLGIQFRWNFITG
jgi:hypothetical protein